MQRSTSGRRSTARVRTIAALSPKLPWDFRPKAKKVPGEFLQRMQVSTNRLRRRFRGSHSALAITRRRVNRMARRLLVHAPRGLVNNSQNGGNDFEAISFSTGPYMGPGQSFHHRKSVKSIPFGVLLCRLYALTKFQPDRSRIERGMVPERFSGSGGVKVPGDYRSWTWD